MERPRSRSPRRRKPGAVNAPPAAVPLSQGLPFDATFFQATLPQLVTAQCQGRPDLVPVVRIDLANGATLDVCHVAALGAAQAAVTHYRDARTCDDMDVAFVPYSLMMLVDVSLHPASARKLGFRLDAPPAPAGADAPGHAP